MVTARTKATHEILLSGICAANPGKELREEGNLDCTRGGRKEPSESRIAQCARGKCSRTDNYDLEEMETDEPSDRARKEQILAELAPMAEKLQRLRKKKQKSKTKNCRGG